MKNLSMLRLATVLLVIALIAGLLGFGDDVDHVWAGAAVLFAVLLVVVVGYLLGDAFKRRSV